MYEIKNPITKKLIFDTICMDHANLDPNGKPVMRERIPVGIYRGYRELKLAILATMDIGTRAAPSPVPGGEGTHGTEILWHDFGALNLQVPSGCILVAERYSDRPIFASKAAIEALSYFWKQLESLPDVDVSVIDEIEGLVA